MSSGATSVSRSASHRHQSGNPRVVPAPTTPHRSQSQSYRGPATSPQTGRGDLASVARRDFEQSNVAQPPPSSHRSSSREGGTTSAIPARSESTRSNNHHRHSSRSEHGRYASIDAASAQQPPTNGIVVDHTPRSMQPATGRRRTTINATTGTWVLGKTIGAGSMGKVKLAKNAETGEQVTLCSLIRLPHWLNPRHLGCYQNCSSASPPTSTGPRQTASGQTTQKRYGQHGRQLSLPSSTTPTFVECETLSAQISTGICSLNMSMVVKCSIISSLMGD